MQHWRLGFCLLVLAQPCSQGLRDILALVGLLWVWTKLKDTLDEA